MYPTKNLMDFMTEMNRLFPKTSENDVFGTPTQISPFSNSTVNKSSSSGDSISPESFPDISHRVVRPPSEFNQQDFLRAESDSPYNARRQRPIVGRRLMSSDPIPRFKENTNYCEQETDFSIWQPNEAFSISSPLASNIFNENKTSPNVFYELFPSDNKYNQLKSPTKMSNLLDDFSNSSPSHMTNSPSLSNMSPGLAFLEPITPHQSPMSSVLSGPTFVPSSSKYPDAAKICTFCRKNGETPLVYMTHMVKQKVGNKQIVTCPILRSHICSTCGASGDQAHTITYCPVLRNSNNGQPLLSTTITLKNTRIKSNGRRRY